MIRVNTINQGQLYMEVDHDCPLVVALLYYISMSFCTLMYMLKVLQVRICMRCQR